MFAGGVHFFNWKSLNRAHLLERRPLARMRNVTGPCRHLDPFSPSASPWNGCLTLGKLQAASLLLQRPSDLFPAALRRLLVTSLDRRAGSGGDHPRTTSFRALCLQSQIYKRLPTHRSRRHSMGVCCRRRLVISSRNTEACCLTASPVMNLCRRPRSAST